MSKRLTKNVQTARFFTKRLDKKKKGGWTAVVLEPMKADKAKKGELKLAKNAVILTAFGGYNNGQEDAELMCDMLNRTIQEFYTKGLTQTEDQDQGYNVGERAELERKAAEEKKANEGEAEQEDLSRLTGRR